MANNRFIGAIAENLAIEYLVDNGYTIIDKNFRCKMGEIDIVAKHNEYIIFVEVKYRKTYSNGLPCEAVNFYKQRTIIKVAKFYLMLYNLYGMSSRFDVVELSGSLENVQINLLKNAFTL